MDSKRVERRRELGHQRSGADGEGGGDEQQGSGRSRRSGGTRGGSARALGPPAAPWLVGPWLPDSLLSAPRSWRAMGGVARAHAG